VKEFIFKPGPLRSPARLILAPDFVEYSSGAATPVRISKQDIIDFRHGNDWIVWYRFTVGRRYSISFRTRKNNELTIQFSDYFGAQRNFEVYAEVVDLIWLYYHQDIVEGYLAQMRAGAEIELQGVRLTLEGIRIPPAHALLPWSDTGVAEYYRYFAVFDVHNAGVHARINYNEYQTEVLWSVIKTMRGDRGNPTVDTA